MLWGLGPTQESLQGEGKCWLYHLLFLHMMCFSLDRKCQEANQKVQELQASQEARADQEQRIRVRYSVSE